jgi:hypothetical protein
VIRSVLAIVAAFALLAGVLWMVGVIPPLNAGAPPVRVSQCYPERLADYCNN